MKKKYDDDSNNRNQDDDRTRWNYVMLATLFQGGLTANEGYAR